MTLAELRGLGISSSSVQHRLAIGRLRRVHQGVFLVGPGALTKRGRWLAAVLACGEGALLSHRSAAALWGLLSERGRSVHVTVPGRRRARRPGIAAHSPRRLHPADRAEEDGIPVTSVARTLVDVAAVAPQRDLLRALEQAERLRLFDLTAVQAVLARAPGHQGRGRLRAALAAYDPRALRTRSELERRFLSLCRNGDVPPPEVNAIIRGFEVDMVWRSARLIVELDGRAYHDVRRAYEVDRRRDTALQVLGWTVLRVTSLRLAEEPQAVFADVRAVLAR